MFYEVLDLNFNFLKRKKSDGRKIHFSNGKDYVIDSKKERGVIKNIFKDKIESFLKQSNKNKKRR